MTWRDDKFPAQLNGVRFHLESARKRGGRRTVAHEFAGVDEAYVEDSGAAPERYELTAFFLGDDYHVNLQRFEDELALGGPLELHHPDRGIIENLRIEGEYSTEHRREQQGYATCSFTLVQDGPAIPLVFDDAVGKVQRASARVMGAVETTFAVKWKASPVDAVALALAGVNNRLAGAHGNVIAQLGPVTRLQRELRSFAAQRDKLLATPKVFAAALRGLIRTLMNTIGSRSRLLGRVAGEFGSPSDLVVDAAEQLRGGAVPVDAMPLAASNSKALAAKTDLDALTLLVDGTVVAAAIEAAMLVPLPTAAAALELAQVFADAIDELLGMPIGLDPIEPEPYEALLVLQTQTVDYLEQLGQQLPKVGSLIVEGGAPVSALLLAYRRYGATPALGVKLDELLVANPEIDPLGVEPGTVLAVLG